MADIFDGSQLLALWSRAGFSDASTTRELTPPQYDFVLEGEGEDGSLVVPADPVQDGPASAPIVPGSGSEGTVVLIEQDGHRQLTGPFVGLGPNGAVPPQYYLSAARQAYVYSLALIELAAPYAIAALAATGTIYVGKNALDSFNPDHPVNVSVNALGTAFSDLVSAEESMYAARDAWTADPDNTVLQQEFNESVNQYVDAVGDLEWAIMGVETYLNGHATLSSSQREQLTGLLNEYRPIYEIASETAEALVPSNQTWTSVFDDVYVEQNPTPDELTQAGLGLAAAYNSNPLETMGYLATYLATDPDKVFALLDAVSGDVRTEISEKLFGVPIDDGKAIFDNHKEPLLWNNPENIAGFSVADINTALETLPPLGQGALLFALNGAAIARGQGDELIDLLRSVMATQPPEFMGEALLNYEYLHLANPVGTASTSDFVLEALVDFTVSDPAKAGQLLTAMAERDAVAVGSLIQRASVVVDSEGGTLGGLRSEMRLLATLAINNPELGAEVADSVDLASQWAFRVTEAAGTDEEARDYIVSIYNILEPIAGAINFTTDFINDVITAYNDIEGSNYSAEFEMAYGIYEVLLSGDVNTLAGMAAWQAGAMARNGLQTVVSTLVDRFIGLPDAETHPQSRELALRVLGGATNGLIDQIILGLQTQNPTVPIDAAGQVAELLTNNVGREDMRTMALLAPELPENLGQLAAEWPADPGQENPVFDAIELLTIDDQATAVVHMTPEVQEDYIESLAPFQAEAVLETLAQDGQEELAVDLADNVQNQETVPLDLNQDHLISNAVNTYTTLDAAIPNPPNGYVLPGGLTIGDQIGSGTTGVIYLATGPEGENFIVKTSSNPVADYHEQAVLDYLSDVDGVMGTEQTYLEPTGSGGEPGRLWAVREYIPNDVTEKAYTTEAGQSLLQTLTAVHGKDVAHQDILLENIRLKDDGNPVLIDFGRATTISTNQENMIDMGLSSQQYGPAVHDVNSMGFSLWQWKHIDAFGGSTTEVTAVMENFAEKLKEKYMERFSSSDNNELKNWLTSRGHEIPAIIETLENRGQTLKARDKLIQQIQTNLSPSDFQSRENIMAATGLTETDLTPEDEILLDMMTTTDGTAVEYLNRYEQL